MTAILAPLLTLEKPIKLLCKEVDVKKHGSVEDETVRASQSKHPDRCRFSTKFVERLPFFSFTCTLSAFLQSDYHCQDTSSFVQAIHPQTHAGEIK
jgi:hypothetical protein